MNSVSRFLIIGALVAPGRLLSAQALTVLHSFGGGPADGGYATAGLIQGSDGYFYGTTEGGGVNLGGTVFKMDSTGAVTILHSFGMGAGPHASLIQASDGFYYGTTWTGGANSQGSVFKIDSSGVFTNLHSFNGADGAWLLGSLVEGTDGNFYGTTSQGGANNTGTVFQMTPAGAVTTLHSFAAGANEGDPEAGLIQASDGLFYGTTGSGGANQQGSIFKITSTGTFTRLHSFNGTDGAKPLAPLLQASDGNFYGTTFSGGSTGSGVIFQMDPAGNVTVLVNLHNDATPTAGLIELADGRLYGTTNFAGRYDYGAIFKVNPANGNYTRLFSFSGPDGAIPEAGLVQGTDGLLYGTTYNGGASDAGVVFSLCTPMPNPTITVVGCLPPSSSGQIASVNNNPGNTYAWTLSGGTIISGQGTSAITFTTGPSATLMLFSVDESNGMCTGSDSTTAQVDFLDVPSSNPFYNFVCSIARAGITAGCGSGNFCPGSTVLRSQMAIFLLVGKHGSGYVPPACTGIFADVACPGPFTNFIEQLYNEAITGGCSSNPLQYCPGSTVSRAGMAVFLLVAQHGTGYAPPPCLGIFSDVTCPGAFTNWIEELYTEGITGGCNTNPLQYCPANPVTRGQMAVFLTATFALP